MPHPDDYAAAIAPDRPLVSGYDADDIIEAMCRIRSDLENWQDEITAQMLPLHPAPYLSEVLSEVLAACKRVQDAAEAERDR